MWNVYEELFALEECVLEELGKNELINFEGMSALRRGI
jgi:hypothetical protein